MQSAVGRVSFSWCIFMFYLHVKGCAFPVSPPLSPLIYTVFSSFQVYALFLVRKEFTPFQAGPFVTPPFRGDRVGTNPGSLSLVQVASRGLFIGLAFVYWSSGMRPTAL